MMCVNVSFSEHIIPIALVVGMKTNKLKDVVKFIAVPSFMCVSFWLVYVCYINMHLPLFVVL